MLPDPRRGHPVALFGRAAGGLERRMWADGRTRGAAYTAVAVGVPTVAAVAVDRRLGGRARVLAVAGVTWAVLGARSLRAEARAVEELLLADDLPAARVRLTHLVGRDTSELSADEVARAAVESVAENSCDAIVAPLLWGAAAGPAGLVGYRAVNTLDAMVGHKSARYLQFGWAAARLDDLANLVPARVTAVLTAIVAPSVGGSPSVALRVARRDGRRHPSPNSGFSEAAFAGALDRRLGGRNVYAGRVEERPVLGDGPSVGVDDLARAQRLSAAVTAVAAVAAFVAAGLAGLATGRRQRSSRSPSVSR